MERPSWEIYLSLLQSIWRDWDIWETVMKISRTGDNYTGIRDQRKELRWGN